MIGSTCSVPDACIGSAQSLSRSLSLVDRAPAESSPATHRCRLFSRWQPPPIFHLTSSPTPYGPVSCKKPFNTQRLVPAPFNEFYPKRSGPTFAASISAIPPEHSG
jgi:hypothetical protein